MINLKYASTKTIRIENEYNEEYDYSDDGGIVYNTDYYEKPRSSTRMHFDDVPPYDNVEETDDAFYSMTDVIYSFPKCKCGQQISIIDELILIRLWTLHCIECNDMLSKIGKKRIIVIIIRFSKKT